MSGNNGWRGEPRPAFPFYAADWLSSERIQSLTLAQQGAYIALLAIQWREGSVSDRIRIRLGSQGLRTDEIDVVLEAFPIDPIDGLRRNLRLERERSVLIERREKALRASAKGNSVRWGSQPDPNGIANASQTVAPHPLPHPHPHPVLPHSVRKKARDAPASLDVLAIVAEFPDLNTPRIVEAAESYVAGRRERRQKPQTARGLRMALKGLVELGEPGALRIIEAATAGGWLGWPADATIANTSIGGQKPYGFETAFEANMRDMKGRLERDGLLPPQHVPQPRKALSP